jgi:ABC-type uncharacterized transport system involved in gliding motility auxiliary subunit
VLAGLGDPVNVDFYLSQDLPPQLISVKDEIRDKLSEFAAYSDGKFRIRYIDPGDDAEAKERAASQGVQEFDVQVVEKDAVSVKKVFFGLVMNYEDKSEAMPIVVEPSSLEYEITSRLVKLTMDAKPKIGLFTGTFRTSEQQQGPSYQGLNEVLAGAQGLYEIVQLDPQANRTLPDDLSAVIVLGAFGMPDSLKYSIDQFLLNGGQVIVGLDPMMQAGQAGGPEQAFPSLPTMEDQLESYGVKFNKKLVVDPECAMATFSAGFFRLQQPYPLWPQITPAGFNPDIAAVSKLESLVMPWTCPLTESAPEGAQLRALASTTEQSFLISSPFNLSPEQDWGFLRSSTEEEGPFVLAYLVEGQIPTAFPDGPPAATPPPPTEDDSEPITLEPEFDSADQLPVSNGEGRLIVMSSASALADNFLGQYRDNVTFLQNAVDMLVLGDQLLGIRSAPVTARPIEQLKDSQKALIRWANVLAVPALLVLFGLLLWFLKGRRRRAIQERYKG